MDSDESQEASSGNESEVETYSTNSQNKGFSNKRSPSPKSSGSGSRSRSLSSESQKSSENSYPQSPNPSETDEQKRPRTPQSPDSDVGSTTNRLQPSSPDNVSNDQPTSPMSANSSRSNSPQPRENLTNNHRSTLLNHNEDSHSEKSDSSQNSRKSKASQDKDSDSSDESVASRSSHEAHKTANLDDGNTSDSSTSSNDSATNKKPKNDSQAEEISDGDIESSDHEKSEKKSEPQSKKGPSGNISISHEDLSDVSDLEDSIDQCDFETSKEAEQGEVEGDNETPEKRKKVIERNSQSEEVEEQLDFEAEDGECADNDNSKEKDDKDKHSEQELGECDDDAKPEKKEELEEGELSDEDDVRPEETEPRPVCRFFSRGQCTWGASCRFLHPGVTDKGNYTMFDLVRPVVPGDYGNERVMYSGRTDPPPVESAWERGLRTAKEMMRKSIKRKEQDIDFEEKKMNLSLAQEELDKENGYYAKAPSPEPSSRYVTMRAVDYSSMRVPHEEYYTRRQIVYDGEYAQTQFPRERVRTYREVPSYRQPDYYAGKHEEESTSVHPKVKRPKREVIVQRAEERAGGRGDEWSDPWMRSKSPVGRKGGRRRSYSSGSSYSSSSSSRSTSASSKSSYKSRTRHKKSSPRTHRRQVSPSVIVSERKAANERAALMNPPAPRKKAPSPGMMRVGAQNPPAPPKFDQFGRTRTKLVAALARVKGQTRSSRSSSGSSSGSSSSDSDSSASSSSSSRNGSPSPRRPTSVDLAMALKAKAIDALKSGSEKRQIKLNLKNTVGNKKTDFAELTRKTEITQGKKRIANSPPPADRDPKNIINKKASSRREELLKQLKAVEDAIAKKRSKPN